MSDRYFSNSYAEARHRFREAAAAVRAILRTYSVDSTSSNELTIDVAVLGGDNDPALVVSSGIHGVEGFFGSAVQLALLEGLGGARSKKNIRLVLIHGINPFGYAHLRRVNEDNVDLNRNFLASARDYTGAPDGYAGLNGLLNPRSPPSRFEPFKLKALWNVWRMGLQSLKEAVAGGQYENPRGLFFGGKGPARSTRIVQDNCDSWVAASQHIVHIDLHTGLGPFGTYKLLLTERADSERLSWYAETFGTECVESLAKSAGTAYRASGLFTQWMRTHFRARDYRSVGAEFGTYDVIRVLGAIRAENRAHHYCSGSSPLYLAAKKELLECFCPASIPWRRQVVASALRIIDQGMQALPALEVHA